MPYEESGPATTGLAHKRQAPAVEICRDVYAGTLRLREKAEKYLPRFPKEDRESYEARKQGSVLFNAFRRTVGGLTGMVFRRDPRPGDDVPERIREHLENIDLAGRHFSVFARDLFEAALIDGHAHIFVDMPPADPDRIRTLADERELRPYWVLIEKQDVLRFRYVLEHGRPVLTAFAYRTCVVVPDGEFGEREVWRIRDYRLEASEDGARRVTYRVFEFQKNASGDGGTWAEVDRGTMSIGRIPLVTCYVRRAGFMTSEPPLLDLALENIKHFQVRSDNDNVLHVASIPILVLKGIQETNTLAIGPTIALKIDDPAGDARFIEPTGGAIEQGRQQLQDIEQRMAALGLAMLQRQTRAAETAEAKRIDKAESDSALAAAARGLRDALEEALELHAMWLDLDAGGSVSVNMDFEHLAIDPSILRELREMVSAGQLSLDTLWDILERYEVLPPAFDPEVERERIAAADVERLPAVAGGLRVGRVV